MAYTQAQISKTSDHITSQLQPSGYLSDSDRMKLTKKIEMHLRKISTQFPNANHIVFDRKTIPSVFESFYKYGVSLLPDTLYFLYQDGSSCMYQNTHKTTIHYAPEMKPKPLLKMGDEIKDGLDLYLNNFNDDCNALDDELDDELYEMHLNRCPRTLTFRDFIQPSSPIDRLIADENNSQDTDVSPASRSGSVRAGRLL